MLVPNQQSNSTLSVFQFDNETPVRVVTKENEPWWVVADVATVLGFKNFHSSLALLDEDEKGLHTVDTPSGVQEMSVVNESGLYSLILRSRKEAAKRFKRWITHEVIPTIRRTGSYSIDRIKGEGSTLYKIPTYAESLRELASSIELNERQAEQIKALEPKAAFHDQVSDSIESVSIADFAKAIGSGEIRFFKWLRDMKFIFKEGRHQKPYQQFIERGYFKLVEKSYEDHNGEAHSYFRILITGKGQIYLADKWKTRLSAS